jgi:hypothetical protein
VPRIAVIRHKGLFKAGRLNQKIAKTRCLESRDELRHRRRLCFAADAIAALSLWGNLDAKDASKSGEASWLSSDERVNATALESDQGLNRFKGNEFSAANDGDPIADALHLADEVTAEEDGATSGKALEE